MRTVEEVRVIRLRMLAGEYGGFSGLNARVGRIPRDSTFSQIAGMPTKGDDGPRKRKPMGSAQARALEKACNKPVGWMDTDPDLWPFGDDLPIERVVSMPDTLKAKAVGLILGMLEVAAPQAAPPRKQASGR